MNLAKELIRPPIKIVSKSWGREVWLVNDEKNNYCGKILEVNAGEGFKMHFHDIKVETFYLLSGEMTIVLMDTSDRSLHSSRFLPGQCLDLNRLVPHAVVAKGDSTLLEVSTFHRDEDSFRI